jgi:hypothetical protein
MPQACNHPHAGQDHRDLVFLQDADYLLDAFLRHLRVDPAQSVIGACFEDDDVEL